MGLEPLLQEQELNEDQVKLRTRFFEATGYGPSDILSISYSRHEFLTRNGGHYQFNGDGLQHLAGPSPLMEDRWEF